MTSRLPTFLFLLMLSFMTFFISLSEGSSAISLWQLLKNLHHEPYGVLLQLRIIRTSTAFVCGGLLGLAGALMQLLLQNPLADPYTLGTSGGAAFMTLLALFFGLEGHTVILCGWLGSILSIGLMFLFAHRKWYEPHALLLAGIAVASGFSALMSGVLILSPDTNLHSMLFWLMGDLNNISFPLSATIILAIGLFFSWALSPGLNLLGKGSQEAKALGLASEKYLLAILLLSALLTATAVITVGCIGFIGMLIPHFMRALFGFEHRWVLPAAVLSGGILLASADIIARQLFAPIQLPVGLIMALMGVPLYIWLTQR